MMFTLHCFVSAPPCRPPSPVSAADGIPSALPSPGKLRRETHPHFSNRLPNARRSGVRKAEPPIVRLPPGRAKGLTSNVQTITMQIRIEISKLHTS